MVFISLFVLFFNNCDEEAIKVNQTHVRIEILNNNINYLNRNMSEEVNIKAARFFLWIISLYEMIYLCVRIENIRT